MDKYILQTKTIYVEKHETKQTLSFVVRISRFDHLVDISSVIAQVPDWRDKYFAIYCPQQDTYIALAGICQGHYLLPREYMQLSVVLIKYYDEMEGQDDEPASDDNKKQRSKERNIKEVIELVRRWRDLHDQTTNGKRINLQEAAKIVGISKKSLDDYFFQLRMGEKYGFDFTANFNNKIGLLRCFVKQHEYQSKKSGAQPGFKHPKKLKIIQEFDKKLHLRDNKTRNGSEKSKRQDSVKLQSSVQLQQSQKSQSAHQPHQLSVVSSPGSIVSFDSNQIFWGSPFSPIGQKAFIDCENAFFKDFQNKLQQPNDPFIPYTSFKKNKSIFSVQESNSSSNIAF